MPLPTPLHERTAPLCSSLRWKDWAGFHAVCRYRPHPEAEYHAIRQSAGLLDVSPLTKIRVEGRDAAAYLSFVCTRNIARLRRGRVTYVCLCDERGKLVDDGTVMRLGETHFRLTAASPVWRWLQRFAGGFEVIIEDESEEVASLALQGPRSRVILEGALGADPELRYFGVRRGEIGGIAVEISRTGYTGDLGYEIWSPGDRSVEVWDALIESGRPHRLLPVGLDALDIARIEAGYVLQGVDYYSAPTCLIDSRLSSPFEAGLGWTVELDRGPFVGSAALAEEQERGSAWSIVGLDLGWPAIERLYARHRLPPTLPVEACRDSRPLYRRGRQVGYITSSTWSPILKQSIAIATVRTACASEGTRLEAEFTVEHVRHTVPARVVARPFFDPPRKRA